MPFVCIEAVFHSDYEAQRMLSLLNRMRDSSWRRVREQLPRRGLVAADSIDTSTNGLLAEYLPELGEVAPAASPTSEDLAVLANCMCGASLSGLFLYLSENDTGEPVRARVEAILRSAGASDVKISTLPGIPSDFGVDGT